MTGEDTVHDNARLRLRTPAHTLHERAVTWWRTQWLLTTAVLGAALAVTAWLAEPVRGWAAAAAGAVAAAGLAGTVFLPRWWYTVHRWEVTDEAVYVRTGYFWQEWRIAPMSRIQTVDTVRGPLEQVFRLATVTVTTASAKGAITIAGLDHEVAADLARRLTRIAQATPGDAT
ncbi:PH domain-containing protein [Streptomyces sp. CC228A]|uniref:PH domain-containing protein n=1 Tax=Streptomyces sp. CC228A TaxID=2898186 RepID=UPI001F1E7BD4|nr:PH domain-containing protein [Streptomyces sp. CC228A]